MLEYKITGEEAEIRAAVDKINDKIYKKYEKLGSGDEFNHWFNLMPAIVVTSTGYITAVSVSIPTEDIPPIEIHLFHTEDNDRIYYEGTDTYESWFKYTQRKWRDVKNVIGFVKF